MFKIDLHVVDHFAHEGRILTTRLGTRTSRFILPAGARISMQRNLEADRATLEIGGYKAITCLVLGTIADIEQIFQAIT